MTAWWPCPLNKQINTSNWVCTHTGMHTELGWVIKRKSVKQSRKQLSCGMPSVVWKSIFLWKLVCDRHWYLLWANCMLPHWPKPSLMSDGPELVRSQSVVPSIFLCKAKLGSLTFIPPIFHVSRYISVAWKFCKDTLYLPNMWLAIAFFLCRLNYWLEAKATLPCLGNILCHSQWMARSLMLQKRLSGLC